MRVAVHAQLQRSLDDTSVKAVVLAGEGRGFCAGAQIPEFASGVIAAYPTAHDVWAQIEQASKPVIAAIHGYALGGGLEFAMACHYRVVAADAKLAAPEVRLGLLPGAGGTQRLPRAVGVERALAMMLSGDRIPASECEHTRLVDCLVRGAGARVSVEEVIDAAIGFARERMSPENVAPENATTTGAALENVALTNAAHTAGERAPRSALPRLRDVPLDFPQAASYFAAQFEHIAGAYPGLLAPPAIARCVQAAVALPFDEGLRFERARFRELEAQQQSKDLRAAFFAERAR